MNAGLSFSFKPLVVLLSLLFFIAFSGLSVWQVYRLFEEQAKVDRIEFANSKSPLGIGELSDKSLLDYLYFRLSVEGRFDSHSCFFVENVVKNGQPGLYIYCPYRVTEGGRWLLVNMGWIKQGADRLKLPEYSIGIEVREIQGLISKPRSRPVIIAGEGKPNSELENLWSYFDFGQLKSQTGLNFYPLELHLTSPVNDILERSWSTFKPKTEMHIGYAIHWAVFALVTLGLFVKFSIQKSD